MGKIKFSRLGKITFLTSFLAGTLLLILFLLTKEGILITAGLYYIMMAFVINLLIALYELVEYITDTSGKKSSGNSVLLMLANIPVAIGYYYFVCSIILSQDL